MKRLAEPESKKPEPVFTEVVEMLEKELQGSSEDQLDLLIKALADVGVSLKDAGLRHRGVSDVMITHYYTRLASSITHVISTYSAPLILNKFENICWRKQDISYIFAASGYRGMRHLVNLCAEKKEDGSFSLSKERALLLLAFLDIDHATDELIEFAFTQSPQVLMPLVIGWLSQRAVLTDRGEENRTKLLQAGHRIENVVIEDRHLPALSVAYMYVTYAHYPRKHEFKRSLNKLYRSLLERRNLTAAMPLPPKRKRPRLLVIHEWFGHSHAMYRCYAPLIAGLKQKFDLHSLASTEGIDAEAAKLFTKSHVVEPLKGGIPGILKLIREVQPDAIFYPSVGMAYWVILLSNLRLAPVQFASQGHPATTMSEFIDFMFVWRKGFSSQHLYSEDVLVSESQSKFEPHQGLAKARPNPKYTVATGEVNVAINAKLMKLNTEVLKACRQITSKSALPVTFHFFVGERGGAFDGIHDAIKAQVPNSTVHPILAYERLLETISLCDFAMSPMPFGNTNSIIDCSLLGVPTVAMVGDELGSQTDALVYELFDGPKELLHTDIEAYTQCAIKLANDLSFRMEMRNRFDRESIYKSVYSDLEDSEFRADINSIWNKYLSLIGR